jgi:hypothetical protein
MFGERVERLTLGRLPAMRLREILGGTTGENGRARQVPSAPPHGQPRKMSASRPLNHRQ